MSKQTIKLTLVEMYAIKHALKRQLTCKEKTIAGMESLDLSKNSKEYTELYKNVYEKLKKDVGHERVLVKMFENEIRDFRDKNNIK